MDRPAEDGEPYATGFECSRREILATGAAVGLAGCNEVATDSPSPTSVDTDTPTPAVTETVDELVDADLTVVDSGFVSKQDGLTNYFRVRVRNDLADETMSSVGVTVEFYGPDLEFLEFQNATISYLGPKEVFEGYVSYFDDDAVAYAVRAERTVRADSRERLGGITVSGHCIDDEQVRGSVGNAGARPVRRLAVRVAFYDGGGDRVGTSTDTIRDLAGGAEADFEVDFDDVLGDPGVGVADYSIAVGDVGDELLAVR